MTTHILDKIFGGTSRVKLMRLFLFHPDEAFEKPNAAKRSKISLRVASKEISFLENLGLIKRISRKKKPTAFVLNKNFIYLNHLKSLLINTVPLQKNSIVKRLAKVCKPKLVVASGIFLQADDSRVDLLIVGDNIKEGTLKSVISQIESEIGSEIRYSAFSTADFKYRIDLQDHLVRDIFDYPHQILIDKIGV